MEFFGPGVAQLSIADRATIANMCPEYGATAAFFPVDNISIKYLEQTGKNTETIVNEQCNNLGTFFLLVCFERELCWSTDEYPATVLWTFIAQMEATQSNDNEQAITI